MSVKITVNGRVGGRIGSGIPANNHSGWADRIAGLNFGGLKRALGELEVISCDNTFLIKNLFPPLPVVDLHIAEIASRAVDGLKWRLANPGASYQEVRITPELILPGKK